MCGEAGGYPTLLGALLAFPILERLASSSQQCALCWFGVKMLQSLRIEAIRAASCGKHDQGKKKMENINFCKFLMLCLYF